jgi:hypothetical protein
VEVLIPILIKADLVPSLKGRLCMLSVKEIIALLVINLKVRDIDIIGSFYMGGRPYHFKESTKYSRDNTPLFPSVTPTHRESFT